MSNAAAGEAPAIPYAGSTVIALAHEHYETIARTVRLLFGLAHTDAYRALVAPEAGPVTAHEPGNFGVFMGYDFHVTPEGPRLIEVNTNAGGALLNGLHTASLVDPERLGCLCAHLMPVADLERDIVATFEDEHAAARAAAGLAPKRLERVAIVDEVPERQFLAPEFELFRALFARAGIEARIADTRVLAPSKPCRPKTSTAATSRRCRVSAPRSTTARRWCREFRPSPDGAFPDAAFVCDASIDAALPALAGSALLVSRALPAEPRRPGFAIFAFAVIPASMIDRT